MKGGITLMICDRCGRGFRPDDMLKHVDPDTGKMKYICERCWEKGMILFCPLEDARLPTCYECNRCGSRFYLRDMVEHVDPDTGKVTYVCERCWRGED